MKLARQYIDTQENEQKRVPCVSINQLNYRHMKKILLILVFIATSWQTTTAQCYTLRHSTTWYDGWISCDESPNPNSAYGNTHWILYDLGYNYTIFKTLLWNANEPDHLDYGIQNYTVDYSTNGTSWTNLGDFTAPQASGSPYYEGDEGPNFGEVTARFVLITPTSNYGGSCYGIGEIRFNLLYNLETTDIENDFKVKAYPNPFNDNLNIVIKSDLNAPIYYSVYDILGRAVLKGEKQSTNSTDKIIFNLKKIQSGLYFVEISQAGQKETVKVIKQ